MYYLCKPQFNYTVCIGVPGSIPGIQTYSVSKHKTQNSLVIYWNNNLLSSIKNRSQKFCFTCCRVGLAYVSLAHRPPVTVFKGTLLQWVTFYYGRSSSGNKQYYWNGALLGGGLFGKFCVQGQTDSITGLRAQGRVGPLGEYYSPREREFFFETFDQKVCGISIFIACLCLYLHVGYEKYDRRKMGNKLICQGNIAGFSPPHPRISILSSTEFFFLRQRKKAKHTK